MEFEYTLENEQQFWDELDDILSNDTHEHELIDDTLRSFLAFVTQFKNEYLRSDRDVLRCAYRIMTSPIFKNKPDYVRTQIVYCLLQEDCRETLSVVTAFVLYDGRQVETTFETLNEAGGFARIVELIQDVQEKDEGLHRLLLELMYEMCRIQRVKFHDLVAVDMDFVVCLLKTTESLSADVEDPYHYFVIRVLLVLNEQYMVCAHEPGPDGSSSNKIANLVITALSKYGSFYKTFGENIILLLNRESETSLQLLILKLLYLLFTCPATFEYFYTNDLRVLVDVMIRNLLDLAYSSTALRHTYLRVLYPLLSHTQLKNTENHYKREELLKLLNIMGGSGAGGLLHFGAMDETTRRLVQRCMAVDWLGGKREGSESPQPRTSPRPQHLTIGQNLEASKSSLSVAEVSSQHAQPGEKTLTREEELAQQQGNGHPGNHSPPPGSTGGGGDASGGEAPPSNGRVASKNRKLSAPPVPPPPRHRRIEKRYETQVEG